MNTILRIIFGISTAFAATQTDSTASSVATQTGDQLQGLADTFIHSIPYWITGGIVIAISFVIAKMVSDNVENKMSEAGLEEEHKEIQIVAGRAVNATIILMGITIGLKIAGIDLTSIVAAGAFGVGFAMQDIITNFMAGIIVLLQKQFTIGDWITVNGTIGIIQEIQSRYTVIRKFDGTKVIVPNAELFKNQVTSLTSNPFRRFQFEFGVDLYLDLKEVIEVIYGSIDKVDKILKTPKPNIIVRPPGGYYNNLRIRCWVISKKGILKPMSALIRQMHQDFYARGWSFPYPTQTLILDKDVPPDVNKRAQDFMDTHKGMTKVKPLRGPGLHAPVAQPNIATPISTGLTNAPEGEYSDKVVQLGVVTAMPQPTVNQPVVVEENAPEWLKKAAEGAMAPTPAVTGPVPMGTILNPETVTQPMVSNNTSTATPATDSVAPNQVQQ